MNVLTPTLLLVASIALLTFTTLASIIVPPVELDSRDVLVIADGVAGVVLAAMAARRLVGIHRFLIAAR